MEKIIRVRYCDLHLLVEAVEVSATRSSPVGIDGTQATIDLCDTCDDSFLGPMRNLMVAIGRRAQQPTPHLDDDSPTGNRVVKVQCTADGCFNWLDVRNRAKHAREHHRCEAWDIEWRYGSDVEQVYLCTCELTFPTVHGLKLHVRKYPGDGHMLKSPDPVAAPRAA